VSAGPAERAVASRMSGDEHSLALVAVLADDLLVVAEQPELLRPAPSDRRLLRFRQDFGRRPAIQPMRRLGLR
jgi:hypothetical protein